MFRLKQGVKLLGVVGMAALLLWLTMMPVVSQQASGIPSRSQTVSTLETALGEALAASAEQPILDPGNAAFVSHTVGNMAWIPLDPTEWTEEKFQLLRDILEGRPGAVTVGIIAVGDDLAIYDPGAPNDTFTLPAGTYLAKVQWDEELQEAVGAIVDQEGSVVTLTRLLVLNEVEVEPIITAPPFMSTKQTDENRFLVVLGSEPGSRFLEAVEAKLAAPPNPAPIWGLIYIIARGAMAIGAIACYKRC